MGCGGSKDGVVSMSSPRRHSLPERPSSNKIKDEGMFSRPGSGPVTTGKVGPTNAGGGDAHHRHEHNWLSEADDCRKCSAQSKSSADSGIEMAGNKFDAVPANRGLFRQDTSSSIMSSDSQGRPAVPRLSNTINNLNDLADMGIVPKTNRNMSSLAFNLELEQPRAASSVTLDGGFRRLPPLPPISGSKQQINVNAIEDKLRRAEERRKKQEMNLRHRAMELSQRRVTEEEMQQLQMTTRETIEQELQQKFLLNEANREKLRLAQLEKKMRNEEKLLRVRQNRERILSSAQGFHEGETPGPDLQSPAGTMGEEQYDQNSTENNVF